MKPDRLLHQEKLLEEINAIDDIISISRKARYLQLYKQIIAKVTKNRPLFMVWKQLKKSQQKTCEEMQKGKENVARLNPSDRRSYRFQHAYKTSS